MSKVAAVTGGPGALGRAVVRRFAEVGYEVFLTAISDEERKTYDGPGEVAVVDLSDLEAARAWASEVGKPVQAAALLAGGFAMRKLEEIQADDFAGMFDLNVKTAVNALSALVPLLVKADSSAAVLVSSQAQEGAAGMALYAASKAAVVSLARSAALELKGRGVRVNAVLPNIIDTPANRAAMPKADFDKWAKPEEVAEVIYYLCSEEAAVVSGNSIKVGRCL